MRMPDDKVVHDTLIPALPDWFVLVAYSDLSGYEREPIIAWRIQVFEMKLSKGPAQYSVPTPLLCYGDADNYENENLAILLPTGRVIVGGDTFYETSSHWFEAHVAEQAKKREAEKA